MRILVRGHARSDLTPEDKARLDRAMARFYRDPPPGVRLECDYILCDLSGSFSVIEVESEAALQATLAPFDGLVRIETFPVFTGEFGHVVVD